MKQRSALQSALQVDVPLLALTGRCPTPTAKFELHAASMPSASVRKMSARVTLEPRADRATSEQRRGGRRPVGGKSSQI